MRTEELFSKKKIFFELCKHDDEFSCDGACGHADITSNARTAVAKPVTLR